METEPVRHVRERFRRVEKVRNMLRISGGGETCSDCVGKGWLVLRTNKHVLL